MSLVKQKFLHPLEGPVLAFTWIWMFFSMYITLQKKESLLLFYLTFFAARWIFGTFTPQTNPSTDRDGCAWTDGRLACFSSLSVSLTQMRQWASVNEPRTVPPTSGTCTRIFITGGACQNFSINLFARVSLRHFSFAVQKPLVRVTKSCGRDLRWHFNNFLLHMTEEAKKSTERNQHVDELCNMFELAHTFVQMLLFNNVWTFKPIISSGCSSHEHSAFVGLSNTEHFLLDLLHVHTHTF